MTAAPGPVRRDRPGRAPSTTAATGALVTPQWVTTRLDEPGVVLVEVDAEPAHHHLAHAPGSTYLDWHDSVRELLAPGPAGRRAFERLMSSRGVRRDDEVVLYGDAGNRYAAAAFWLMRYHGHRRLRLMDGGRAAWTSHGLPLTDAETRRPRSRYVAAGARPDLRATRDDVLARVRSGHGALLLDCRSPGEFAGHGVRAPDRPELGGVVPGLAVGRLPGALSLPAGRLLDDDGRLRSDAGLAGLLSEVGVSRDRPVLTYCHRSERSCLAWFVLAEVLGHPDVRVYDGGWQEYANLPDALVERDPQPSMTHMVDDGQ